MYSRGKQKTLGAKNLFKQGTINCFVIDYHIHSAYSLDGKFPPSSYIECAEEKHMREIGFSEHVDLDPTLWGYNFLDYSSYQKTLEALQSRTAVCVRCGIEVSYQQHLERTIRDYLSTIECDFVIGSVHEVNRIPMDHTFFDRFSPVQYFESVEDMVASGMFDIVGHLEYFKRWGSTYSSSQFSEEICLLLQVMIDRNVALEVNTSGLRHPAQDTYPSLKVLHLYKQLGGELITLGSDAHHVHDLAFHFQPVIGQLKSQGFHTIATFRKRTLTLTEL
ncbi:MAG: hypothetical protein AYK18_04040 [Theionarchaea archaeon DG-70]|nr:MAG: hypothetical protein AYK18_04040 [Theionarchaea archaeon DG-70]